MAERLTNDQVLRVVHAATSCGFYDRVDRGLLLSGVPQAIANGLPLKGTPRDQLQSDIEFLNRISDDSAAIGTWLIRAVEITGGLEVSHVFQSALAGLSPKETRPSRTWLFVVRVLSKMCLVAVVLIGAWLWWPSIFSGGLVELSHDAWAGFVLSALGLFGTAWALYVYRRRLNPRIREREIEPLIGESKIDAGDQGALAARALAAGRRAALATPPIQPVDPGNELAAADEAGAEPAASRWPALGDGYGIVRIHLPTGLSIMSVAGLLQGVNQLYRRFSDIEHATHIINEPGNSRYAQQALLGVQPELRVLSARPSGSWDIDILGKLTALKPVASLLTTIRDWRADREAAVHRVEAERIRLSLAKLEFLDKAGSLLEPADRRKMLDALVPHVVSALDLIPTPVEARVIPLRGLSSEHGSDLIEALSEMDAEALEGSLPRLPGQGTPALGVLGAGPADKVALGPPSETETP